MAGPQTRAALRRTSQRYRVCDRFTRIYVACKLRMDPVHTALLTLAEAAPFGEVIDLGCGRGQLAVALLEAGLARSVLALDRDTAALAQLRRAATGLPLRAIAGDLAGPHELAGADTVLLIDVLYQLTTELQLTLLRSAAALARHRLIVRTADPAAGWRSTVSAVLERLGRGLWPTFGERVNPLPLSKLRAALEGHGFTVTQTPCAQGTPLANVLLVASRLTPQTAS